MWMNSILPIFLVPRRSGYCPPALGAGMTKERGTTMAWNMRRTSPPLKAPHTS
ncbi:GRHL3 isoform 5 [Pan troglodytes]|uniref:GRHL3 isoform 5 n=2 Tax=Hominidae TaxID=9604 RepID=A0A2J8SIW6_PONAB|nr:GRHL3 isoform 5 [Pan troglodytes]PNJ20717.1 GRHL3 isoform 5 [Pongo abelii]